MNPQFRMNAQVQEVTIMRVYRAGHIILFVYNETEITSCMLLKALVVG